MLHNVIQQNSILTNDKQLIENSFASSMFHFKATILTVSSPSPGLGLTVEAVGNLTSARGERIL